MLITQPTPATRHPTHVYLAGILQMLLRNGIAGSLRRPRPCTLDSLNNLRTHLLQDPFFDRHDHRPEELTEPRMRPAKVLFSDLVVLMAEVIRVLMRPDPLTGEEEEERVRVRNEALRQPFFDRESEASRHPFSDGPLDEDEGCVL